MINKALLDSNFLRKLDFNRNKVTYARITSLTNEQYPVERIEGIVTAGSISIDGKSAVRRVCNLTLTTEKLNIDNIYWSLTTRVQVEIGLENTIDKKYDDIIWFPQGVFVLNTFKTSAQVNRYQVSLSGKDKMCLLNGDVSGDFNAETQLDSEYVQQKDGTWVSEKKPISYIIREMVHHYAQESFHNIIIKDIDTLSLKVMNNKSNTFYLLKSVTTGDFVNEIYYIDFTKNNKSNKYYYSNFPGIKIDFNNINEKFIFDYQIDEDNDSLLSSDELEEPWTIYDAQNELYTIVKINPGDDLGYQLTETYYPDELIAAVGDTVTSVLDKIVKTFGEYEYFYNIYGQFIFKAKEVYVNTHWNDIKQNNENYIPPEEIHNQSKYSFEGSVLNSAYDNTPNLGNIKNDFTIWGTRKTATGMEIPIHARYAIDRKPEYYKSYDKPQKIYVSKEYNKKYNIEDNSNYSIVDWREIIYQMALDYYKHSHDDDFSSNIQLFNIDENSGKSYYEAGRTGYEQYYHDIEGFWRLLYAPEDYLKGYRPGFNTNNVVDKNDFYKNGKYCGPWSKKVTECPSELLFWFDFFDADGLGLGQFSVPAIGNRPKNKTNDKVRAIIYQDIPDIILIDEKTYENYENTGKLLTGYTYIIVDNFIQRCLDSDDILLSTRGLTAQEQIDDMLYNFAYCNETINITGVPIYYLEPNTIISAKDEKRTVNGYYILNKITLPLDYKGTMKINAIKVPERIY